MNKIKNIRDFYKNLSSNTRLLIRITSICVFSLLIISIYTYTATNNPYYYEFLSISEELLQVTKSVGVIGFIGTITIFSIEKKHQTNADE